MVSHDDQALPKGTGLKKGFSMSQKSCPKCGYAANIEAPECAKCGIVFGKFIDQEAQPDAQVLGNKVLVDMWKNILENYENQQLHDAFIQTALQYKKLNFASQQYRKMMEINPLDETAKQMQNKIIQIVSFQMMSQKSGRKFKKPPKWNSAGIAGGSLLFFIGMLTGNLGFTFGGIVLVAVMFGLRFKKSEA